MDLSQRQLIGITLWWAEGTKSRRDIRWKKAVSYPVEVTNTNPAIIKVFLDFLRHDIEISNDKIRIQLQIHQGDEQDKLEAYWRDITGVEKQNFNKTIIRPVGRKIGKSHGTCKIRFADKATYKQLEMMLIQSLTGVYASPDTVLKVYDPGKVGANLLE